MRRNLIVFTLRGLRVNHWLVEVITLQQDVFSQFGGERKTSGKQDRNARET